MTKHFAGAVRTLSIAVLFLGPAGIVFVPISAHAQVASVRSLSGTVTDKGGNKVANAVVHLKDTRSLSQRSYITTDDGTFRFGQLSGGTDYEVWATLNDKKTPSKSISSFDNKKEIEVALKIPN